MRLAIVAALLALTACSPAADNAAPAATGDGPLDCAALISAADRLIADGVLPADGDFQAQVLIAAMTHLNAYAVPEGVSEPDAFKALNLRRGELMDTVTGDEILARAKACVANTPN
ncbi:MAG: hypothetical protein R3C13_04960 [Hyphomonas sp.]|uniref:hypothetical protein n=1 Tax=Hyphomonas sp. TaxID=87 RepID=UPI003528AB6A